MPRQRILAVALVAAFSFAGGLAVALGGLGASTARGDTCTLPSCQTTTTTPPPSSSPVVSSTSAPSPRRHKRKPNAPPDRVTLLRAHNTSAHGILITWRLPAASDLASVFVRRVQGTSCVTRVADGQPLGSGAIRTRQWDTTARVGVHYCYSVFAVDRAHNVSPSNDTGPIALPDKTPPAPVSNVTASAAGGRLVVSWPGVAGADHYLVMRGTSGSCPVAVSSTGAVKSSAPSLTDTTAKPGVAYCYSVYSADASGNVQHTGATSNTVTLASTTLAASTSPATSGPAASSSSNHAVGSQLSRMVAAVGAATFVFGLIMLIGIRLQGSSGRRRVQSFYYPRHRGGLARVALDQYDARALVIPGVLFVGLIVLAAAAALAL